MTSSLSKKIKLPPKPQYTSEAIGEFLALLKKKRNPQITEALNVFINPKKP
jgi:hypothetical protein